MIFKYLFANKLSTKLRVNLCNYCVSRLVSTGRSDKYVPKSFYNTKDNDFYLCIEDIKIAKIVAKYVTSNSSEDMVIFESCPGSGLLTKELLKSGVKSVRVFEENPIYLKNLSSLKTEFGDRFQIIERQILNFSKFLSNHLNEYEYEIDFWFQNLSVKEWRTVPTIKFVSVLSPKNSLFLRFIIKTLLKKDLFFSFGRTEFLVFVSQNEYKYMNAKPAQNYSNYRSTSVLYNTLFDIETLETVPYKSFHIYNKSSIEVKLSQKKLEGTTKLIRLTPKLYLDEFNSQTLLDYYFFVNQTFMKRKNYIIPFLENWFPNCGPDLIKKGIPVFKYFGDLKPEEVLDLFKYFYNRSDYQNSLYKTLAMNEDYDSVEDSVDSIKEDVDMTIDCEHQSLGKNESNKSLNYS